MGPLSTTRWDPSANYGEGGWEFFRAYQDGGRWVNMQGYSVGISVSLSYGMMTWYGGGAFYSRFGGSYFDYNPANPPSPPVPRDSPPRDNASRTPGSKPPPSKHDPTTNVNCFGKVWTRSVPGSVTSIVFFQAGVSTLGGGVLLGRYLGGHIPHNLNNPINFTGSVAHASAPPGG